MDGKLTVDVCQKKCAQVIWITKVEKDDEINPIQEERVRRLQWTAAGVRGSRIITHARPGHSQVFYLGGREKTQLYLTCYFQTKA